MKFRKICLKFAVSLSILFFQFLPHGISIASELPAGGTRAATAETIAGTGFKTAFKTVFAAAAETGDPDFQPPSTPEGLAAIDITYTTVSLSWPEPADNVGVKGYMVFRDGKKITTTSKAAYTNKKLVPGRQYVYFIKAYDANGNVSAGSKPLSISTIPDVLPPSVPGSLSVSSVSHTSVVLEWKPSSDNVGVKRYEIFMGGSRKGSISATSYTCKGLTPGMPYSFTVRASDASGNYSSGSSPVYASTMEDRSVPFAPSDLRVDEMTETQAFLRWSPSTDNVKVKKYEIYCDGKQVGTTSKTSYNYKKLLPGKSYEFYIRAVDTSGLRSPRSPSLRASTKKDLEAPTIPQNLRISAVKKSSVSLSWNASTDNVKVKGYIIYCNGSAVATATRKSRSVKKPSGFGAGIYWIRAFDQSGNLSGNSNTVTAVAL